MKYPIPILSVKTLHKDLEKLGAKLKSVTTRIPLNDLNQDSLSPEQSSQLRFVPKIEVISLQGDINLWFRFPGPSWVTVFVLLPGDLVLLTAEYMAGSDSIIISHCGGLLEKDETPEQGAIREVQEESGLLLSEVVTLSENGLPVSPRRSGEKVYPFLGIPQLNDIGEPIFIDTKQDVSEDTYSFLLPLKDYWDFLDSNYSNTVTGRDCTYAALRKLGKINLL